MTTEDKSFADAVGHIPSGLFIITSKDGGVIDGYLASWVQQISFSPLLVALAISPSRPGYNNIISGKTFSINIVGDHDTQYMRHFWKSYDAESNPFKSEIEHTITPSGAVNITAAKSVIECQFESKIIPGDHEIIIAKVLNSYVNNTEAKSKVHLRKNGLDY